MICGVQENTPFNIEINGHNYECIIQTNTNCNSTKFRSCEYIRIEEFKKIDKKFLWFKYKKFGGEFICNYIFSLERFDNSNYNPHYIISNGEKYYNIADVRKWVIIALKKRRVKTVFN